PAGGSESIAMWGLAARSVADQLHVGALCLVETCFRVVDPSIKILARLRVWLGHYELAHEIDVGVISPLEGVECLPHRVVHLPRLASHGPGTSPAGLLP